MDIQSLLAQKHKTTCWIGVALSFQFVLYLALVLALPSLLNKPDFQGFQLTPERIDPSSSMAPVRFTLLGAGAMLVALSFVLKGLLAQRAQTRLDLPNVLQQSTIMAFAIAEAGAICGLALFLLYGLRLDFFLLWSIGLAGFIAHLPRLSAWEQRLRDFQA